ncbi:TetR/AcrR family transcriptional regulator [Streptosporangium sp. NPDC006013]|uniref:TetR/AcrR family transcriptional regulator n=1 Tax=Streptosporangium sp. NPDC006013 TaxID=3155596 RepID=UPI0033BBBF0C
MAPKPAPESDRQVSPSPRGVRRREQIVDVALTLFASSGYRGTGMTEVASQVGITEPGVLYHFGTKVGLLHAVIEQRAKLSQAFARDVAEQGGLAGIREIIALAHRSAREPDLIKLFAVLLAENFEDDGPAHDFFVEHYRALRVSVVELIEAGQRRGELRADVDPALKAVEILGTLDGMANQWLLDPEAVDFVACVEAYVATLERDLALAPSS